MKRLTDRLKDPLLMLSPLSSTKTMSLRCWSRLTQIRLSIFSPLSSRVSNPSASHTTECSHMTKNNERKAGETSMKYSQNIWGKIPFRWGALIQKMEINWWESAWPRTSTTMRKAMKKNTSKG
jgi:hypothetical protein